MKYAFNTWVYSSFPSWLPAYPLDETIKRLARIGYDGIELGCTSPHAWPDYLSKDRRREINALLKDNGIVISSVLAVPGGGPGANVASVDEAERAWTTKHLKDVCDLAVDLNCKTMLYVAGWYIYGTRQSVAWANSLNTLKEVGKYAADKGVTICVEPTATDSNLVESMDDALTMMEQSGLANVAVMFDTAHAMHRCEVPTDYIYQMGKHLKHIHLTDYDRKAPGTAGCDFVAIMQALKDIDYAGYVTMETGFPSRSVHPDSVARISLETLKGIEAKLK
jgi:fructoselysine 3-epimerase